MNIWMIFTKNYENEYMLYAYTNDEKLKKSFEEFRNMDKFKVTKKKLDKKEYKDFVSTYPNKQLVLTKLKTKTPGELIELGSVDVVCTWEEEKNTVLQSDESTFIEARKVMFNPSELSISVQTELMKLGFFKIYQFLYNQMYIDEPLYGPEYDGVFDDELGYGYKPGDIKVDQFAIFMHLYGDTVKK